MAKQIKLKDLIGEAKSYNLDIETEAEYSEIIDDFVTLKVDRRATVTSTASNITIAQFGKTDNTKALKKILKYADSNLDVNTIKNNFEASDDERSGNDQEQDIWKYTIDKKLDFHKAKKAGILKEAPITKMDNAITASLIDMMSVYTSDANPLADTQWTSLEDFMKSAADYITGSDWKKFQKDVERQYPVLESSLNEADKYETDDYKVGDTIDLLKYNWKVIEADFKPGKSYKDSFTFVDNKQVDVKAPPTNKNAVGYKLEDGDDSAFYFTYKATSGKTITKLAVKGFNESVLNEGAINIFADEMNDEGVTADIFDAIGDGSKVNGQFTKKKWDDGVPVTKYLSRGGVKSIKTPNGKFQIIETKSFWYYEIDKGWAAISKIEYGTPPFEY